MKAAFVGLIGRPSSGKSTFLNQVCGNKVSIISSVPQTTRNRIRGIFNSEEGQLVFIDTPGFHLSEKELNLHLKDLVVNTLKRVEIILYLVDITRAPGEEEWNLMELLSDFKEILVIGLNKIDLNTMAMNQVKAEILNNFENPRIYPISALTGDGIPPLIQEIFALSPEGEKMYPEEYYTDQTPEFRISEIIREKAIHHTHSEVPHSIYVDISDLEMRNENRLLWVRGFIYVERESQKGILVGKNGGNIKSIVREAEEELSRLFPYSLKLDIRVKVKHKWRKDRSLLKKLIS